MSCFYDHVIHRCLHCFADLLFQACLNHALVGSPGVFESKGHSIEAEGTVRGDECGCSLVQFFHLDLVVSGIGIEETQRIVSCGCVNDLVDAGQWEGVFRASLVEVFEVEIQAP